MTNMVQGAEPMLFTSCFLNGKNIEERTESIARQNLNEREGGFVRKSALISFLLRTLSSNDNLGDLDLQSIFCYRTLCLRRFLSYRPTFVKLLHMIGPFYPHSISTVQCVNQASLFSTDSSPDVLQKHAGARRGLGCADQLISVGHKV